jgi:hypothetical protein
MAPDREPIETAKAARRRLIDAQLATDRARAEYEHAVRRAHAGGTPLRQIADALGVSHQRIHRIVDAGPPRRRWRRWKRDPPRICCTFCGRADTEVGKIIAGPAVYICDGCTALATAVVDDRAAHGDDRVRIEYLERDIPRHSGAGKQRTGCSFCGMSRKHSGALVGTPAAHICDACLHLCREIIAEESATP